MATNEPTMDQLATIDQNGFTAAIFPEIRNAIAQKMRDIYGNDIDLSAASADAQYVTAEALMVNNIYRVLESLANGLNPSTATGKYLDILASFSGAFRQSETSSTAQLYIWNTGVSAVSPEQIECMDKNGNTWIWVNPKGLDNVPKVSLPPMGSSKIPSGPYVFKCEKSGPVQAYSSRAIPTGTGSDTWADLFNTAAAERGGDIYQPINIDQFSIVQIGNATPGQYRESDGSLRSRRNLSFGQAGSTVLNSLTAALRAIEGVDDVLVYAPVEAKTNFDGDLDIPAHSVYVIIAIPPTLVKWSGNTYSMSDQLKQLIGNTIYEQLTPGIPTIPNTTEPASGTGALVTYSVPIIQIGTLISQDIVWKQCKYITSDINVKITLADNNLDISEKQQSVIGETLINYFNGLKIKQSPNANEIANLLMSVDFKSLPYGLPTYSYDTTTVLPSVGYTKIYVNHWAYNNKTFTFSVA